MLNCLITSGETYKSVPLVLTFIWIKLQPDLGMGGAATLALAGMVSLVYGIREIKIQISHYSHSRQNHSEPVS
jgi:hypothetical protein